MKIPLQRTRLSALMAVAAIYAITITFLLVSAEDAAAQCQGAGGFVPLECFQGSRLAGAYNEPEFGPFIQKLFVGAISFGAVLAVLRLAWAGFQYMSSDLWSKKDHAKEIIRDTLLGLFLLIAIYLILWQINPDIVNLKIEQAPITR